MDWIPWYQNEDYWWTLVKTVTSFRATIKCGKSIYSPTSFLRAPLLGVLSYYIISEQVSLYMPNYLISLFMLLKLEKYTQKI